MRTRRRLICALNHSARCARGVCAHPCKHVTASLARRFATVLLRNRAPYASTHGRRRLSCCVALNGRGTPCFSFSVAFEALFRARRCSSRCSLPCFSQNRRRQGRTNGLRLAVNDFLSLETGLLLCRTPTVTVGTSAAGRFCSLQRRPPDQACRLRPSRKQQVVATGLIYATHACVDPVLQFCSQAATCSAGNASAAQS